VPHFVMAFHPQYPRAKVKHVCLADVYLITKDVLCT